MSYSKCLSLTLILSFLLINPIKSQNEKVLDVFEGVPINFTGFKNEIEKGGYIQDGRIVYKKIKAPVYKKGTDVKIKMTLKSAGDRWDKSGSVFVITQPDMVDILDVAKGLNNYPELSGQKGYPGIKRTENYIPALELLRFMTPFGVGFYSNEEKHPELVYGRPVSVPDWEKEVKWEQDISHLSSELTGEIVIGVWLDTWTKEGYEIDLELIYSGRPLSQPKVLPLVNTIYYAAQKHPDLFAYEPLKLDFQLPEDAKNARLYYITTGHGGHSGGDEFIRLRNKVIFDNKVALDTVPWRNDCASFRRFNPSSGVWTRKDTARAYNREGEKVYKEIEERLASSDLSRSNWCPGSQVEPFVMSIGELKKGRHQLEIDIDATPIDGDKLNHWLVSAYLTYEVE